MGMMLVPIFVGRIMSNGAYEEVEKSVHSEYIFIALGIIAITVATLLKFNSKKHPELKIDRPSKELAE